MTEDERAGLAELADYFRFELVPFWANNFDTLTFQVVIRSDGLSFEILGPRRMFRAYSENQAACTAALADANVFTDMKLRVDRAVRLYAGEMERILFGPAAIPDVEKPTPPVVARVIREYHGSDA
jgi:hypothetical protein